MAGRWRVLRTDSAVSVRPGFLVLVWCLGWAAVLGIGLLDHGWPPIWNWQGLVATPLVWPLLALTAGPVAAFLPALFRGRPNPAEQPEEIPEEVSEVSQPQVDAVAVFTRALESVGHAVFAYDGDGRIRLWNAAAGRLFGYTPEQILGEPASRLVPPWCSGETAEHLRLAREGDRLEGIVTQRLTRLGRVVDVELAVGPFQDEGEAPDGVLCSLFELTRYRQEVTELELLGHGLEEAQEAIVLTDPENDNLVLFANAAASRLTGYSHEELLGRNLRFLQGEETHQESLQALRSCLERGTPCRVVLRNFRKNGTAFWNELSVTPVRSEGGRVLRYLGVLRDLSAQRSELVGLEQRVRTLAGLLEQAPLGVALCDSEGVIREANPLLAKLLGLSKKELSGRRFTEFATDRPDSEAGLPHQGELVLRRSNGDEITARLRHTACRSDPGLHALYLLDITDRKHSERSLVREQERIQGTLASMGDAVITTNTRGVVDYLNPAAETITGWRNEEGQGLAVETVFRVVDERTRERLGDPVHRCLALGRKVRLPEGAVLLGREGQEFSVQASAAPIRDPSGKTVGAVLVLQDVSRMQRIAREVSEQASTDPLTGLGNRRELERHLQETLDDARVEDGRHALCFIDLDHFKPINDNCGHSAGDQALQEVAAVLREQVRSSDVVARIGGDEFALLLHDCTPDKALEIANGVCQAVAGYRFRWRGRSFVLGASVGLVTIGNLSGTVDDLVEAADAACYGAKKSGRSRVQIYEPARSELEARHSEMSWASRIGEALETGGLRLEVQAIQPLADEGNLPLNEILVRYQDENQGTIAPMAFLPTLERYKLLPDLDRWVVSEALRTLGAMRTSGTLGEGSYLINVSAQSLESPGFADLVLQRLEVSGMEPHRICFELRVSAFSTHSEAARHFMRSLHGRGCRFAVDGLDNGTYLLDQLRHLPFDYIKFDPAVGTALREGPVGAALVEGLNYIAQAAGAQTIVTHVEDEVSMARLKAMEVDYVQGHLVGAPAPLGEKRRA